MTAAEGPVARERVAWLLDQAGACYAGDADAIEVLAAARRRLREPLRVAIAGKVKAGKSTLLNALVGAPLAPTDAGECTRIITWYRDGLAYAVRMHPVEGEPRPLRFRRGPCALEIDLDDQDPSELDRLVVEWPSTSLRTMTLIDTPGIGSLSTEVSARTQAFLTPETSPGEADAVCYLMRHLHATDARFLETFRDGAATPVAPMNAIGVLSRADEIGAGRLAALESAARIAQRYRRDPQVRQLCQTVLPVAGLLAETATTLREDEFAALAALVAVDRPTLDGLLLSVDRFAAPDAPVDADADVRRALLARFGVFGVRLSIALIRSRRTTTATALARALVDRSGVTALRDTLVTQFSGRAELLKARSGLAVLSSLIDAHPVAGTDWLAGEIERITSDTHAFAEAGLLNALRAGAVAIDDAGAQEAERLLGGNGADPVDRLGMATENGDAIDDGALHAAAVDALTRWRQRSEHPLASRAATEAARVVARSCEGIVAGLPRRSSVPHRPPAGDRVAR
jgi:50S ribosome-binding GTPase